MTILEIAKFATLVTGIALATLTVALVVVKVHGIRSERRARTLRTKLRPRVLAALDDGGLELDLAGRDGRIVEQLVVSMLGNVRGSERARLAELLAQGGTIARAESDLQSRRAAKRQSAAELLGAAGHEAAVPSLVERLEDRDVMVRMAAGRALGKTGSTAAVQPLLRALADRSIPANTASMAILRIGPHSAPALVPALSDPVARVRATAAELIGTFGYMDARAQLETMLDDEEPAARLGAVRALGRLGSPRSTTRLAVDLTNVLDSPMDYASEELAVAEIVALGQIQNRSAIPLLTECLGLSHRISYAAAEALAPMGRRRSRRSEMQRRTGEAAPNDAAGLSSGEPLPAGGAA